MSAWILIAYLAPYYVVAQTSGGAQGAGNAGSGQTGGAQPGGQAGVQPPAAGNTAPTPAGAPTPVRPPTAPGTNFGAGQQPFFSDPGVRRQLNLNNQRFDELSRHYTELMGRFQQDAAELQNNNLPPQQREARLRELQRSFNQEFSRSANQFFADEVQRRRFNQLSLQFQGFGAFNHPAVQQQLRLSPEQQQQLLNLEREWTAQLENLRRGFRTDIPGTGSRFNDLRALNAQRIDSILTREQQRVWRELLGDPYEFPAPLYFEANQPQ
jgi:hypothetical protein